MKLERDLVVHFPPAVELPTILDYTGGEAGTGGVGGLRRLSRPAITSAVKCDSSY